MAEDRDLRELARRALGRALAERGRERHAAGRPETPGRSRASGVHVELVPASGAPRPAEPSAAPAPLAPPRPRGAELVGARCLAGTPDGGTYVAAPGARVSSLAREEAFRRRIRIVEGAGVRPAGGLAGRVRVALGADHGGFALKERVREWLAELGCEAHDLGTRDESPCDYPDLALAVAEQVASHQAELGVLVDGAGIGSAIAANKVAGVRAATCWNEASARNAREHNHANVLALGAKMLGEGEAHAILRAFLATAPGGERHARRVEKITAIERRSGGIARPDGTGAVDARRDA